MQQAAALTSKKPALGAKQAAGGAQGKSRNDSGSGSRAGPQRGKPDSAEPRRTNESRTGSRDRELQNK